MSCSEQKKDFDTDNATCTQAEHAPFVENTNETSQLFKSGVVGGAAAKAVLYRNFYSAISLSHRDIVSMMVHAIKPLAPGVDGTL